MSINDDDADQQNLQTTNRRLLDIDTQHRESENTFKILIATDIHLGYNERDPIRGNDSYESFEEVLQIAQDKNVDFILLGGDLFDANKPTQYTLQRAVNLIKKYTFGDRDITFEVIEDFEEAVLCDTTAEIIQEAIPDINFCDPHLNIAIPVFSIHGNHDDPTGMKSVSSLDTLSSMGLVNYIGRQDQIESLEIKPLMLKKGTTELALYGVGHLSDRRFARLHRDGRVAFHQVNADTAFQLLVLHQNRANRGLLNFLPYNAIPYFIDLVMWGHEHDCFIEPALINNIYYTQPGSTVATSLSAGEAIPKKVGILHVNQKHFYIENVQLKHVRLLLYKDVILDTAEDLLSRGCREAALSEYSEKEAISLVQEMLKEAEKTREENHKTLKYDNEMLPLIRLVVKYVDERQCFNDKKISMLFADYVANPQDIILQKRILISQKDKRTRHIAWDDGYLQDDDQPRDVMTFLKHELDRNLIDMKVCTSNGAVEALSKFVNCSDSYAFDDYIDYRKKKFLHECENLDISNDNDEEIAQKFNEIRERLMAADETNEVRKLLENPNRVNIQRNSDDLMEDLNGSSSDVIAAAAPAPAPPAPAPRGKGSRGGGRGRGRGRGAKTTKKPDDSMIVDIDSDEDIPAVKTRPSKGSRRGRGK